MLIGQLLSGNSEQNVHLKEKKHFVKPLQLAGFLHQLLIKCSPIFIQVTIIDKLIRVAVHKQLHFHVISEHSG